MTGWKKTRINLSVGGTADERVERDTEMDRQIGEDDEGRDRDVPTLPEITDRHGDLAVSQSVSHIHSWPHNSAGPNTHTHTHTMALLCVYVCVPNRSTISRYSGPTEGPRYPLPLHL